MRLAFVLFAMLAAGLVCAPAARAQGAPACSNCGTVQTIKTVSERQQWTPLGTVTDTGAKGGGPGGQTGGQAVYSIGPGFTNRGMVVIGAAGGAAYAQKPNEYQRQRWEVTVKLDSGPPPRILNLSYEPLFSEGDRGRVFGNQLELINP